MKNPYFRKKLQCIEVERKEISQLLKEMAGTGFQGRRLGEAFSIWRQMLMEKNLTIIMGYSGSMSTTGMWKIVCWLIENRFIDVLVSTGANISEDLLEALGGEYWQGSPLANDAELLKHKIDRFYDVYADEMRYRVMEGYIRHFARTLKSDHNYSSREFLYLLGKHLSEKKVRCITSTAYENRVPIFCPAFCDSGYGIALLLARRQGYPVVMDQTKDVEEFTMVAERAKETGVIYLGGGVPKNFTQQVTVILTLEEGGENLSPHKYAVQITTDSPQWGGLSGCTFEEAVSWGKISSSGKHVQCFCDATIALPLLAHAINETVSERADHPDFEWLFKQ